MAEIIALKSKSHVFAEPVILPAIKKVMKIMLGDKTEREVGKTLLLNNTIQRRILDLSDNIEESVISKFQKACLLSKLMNPLTSVIMHS